jgi:hypothetical protein
MLTRKATILRTKNSLFLSRNITCRYVGCYSRIKSLWMSVFQSTRLIALNLTLLIVFFYSSLAPWPVTYGLKHNRKINGLCSEFILLFSSLLDQTFNNKPIVIFLMNKLSWSQSVSSVETSVFRSRLQRNSQHSVQMFDFTTSHKQLWIIFIVKSRNLTRCRIGMALTNPTFSCCVTVMYFDCNLWVELR